jgi:hypothetical protein
MECIDRFGDLRVYVTCSGNPTAAVKAAMVRLKEIHQYIKWVSTVPNEHELQGYDRDDGRPCPIKLAKVDNPPNVCAASKLLQFAMSERLAPVSLTEAYGRTGDLKPSCATCTKNVVQMMCGMALARRNQFDLIQPSHDDIIATLEQEQEHAEAVESWESMIPIRSLDRTLDPRQFRNVYDYVARRCGPYDGSTAHDAMVALITSEDFLTTFEEDPDAREAPVVAERTMLPTDKPTKEDRQRANKASAKERKRGKTGKSAAAAAAASSAPDDEDDEPKPNWKQLLSEKANEDEQ